MADETAERCPECDGWDTLGTCKKCGGVGWIVDKKKSEPSPKSTTADGLNDPRFTRSYSHCEWCGKPTRFRVLVEFTRRVRKLSIRQQTLWVCTACFLSLSDKGQRL